MTCSGLNLHLSAIENKLFSNSFAHFIRIGAGYFLPRFYKTEKRATIYPRDSLKNTFMLLTIRREIMTLLVFLGTLHLLARFWLVRGWGDGLATGVVNFTVWPMCFTLCLCLATELTAWQEQRSWPAPLARIFPWLVPTILFLILTWLRFSA